MARQHGETPLIPERAAQFTQPALRRSDLDATSPTRQFTAWFREAQQAGAQAETCTLATAALPSGRVSARTVYLKGLDEAGAGPRFVVYTNVGTSGKAADVASNGHAALVFYWAPLQRQVRIEGTAAVAGGPDGRRAAQRYFNTRARGSRIGAWASRQSEPLAPLADGDDGRARLDAAVAETERRFDGVEAVPVPDHWGGLCVVPDRIEFWQGRDSRLHDRFVYERIAGGEDEWTLTRLNP